MYVVYKSKFGTVINKINIETVLRKTLYVKCRWSNDIQFNTESTIVYLYNNNVCPNVLMFYSFNECRFVTMDFQKIVSKIFPSNSTLMEKKYTPF